MQKIICGQGHSKTKVLTQALGYGSIQKPNLQHTTNILNIIPFCFHPPSKNLSFTCAVWSLPYLIIKQNTEPGCHYVRCQVTSVIAGRTTIMPAALICLWHAYLSCCANTLSSTFHWFSFKIKPLVSIKSHIHCVHAAKLTLLQAMYV